MTAAERAVLIGLNRGLPGDKFERSMEELELLADTAGATVIAKYVQKRNSPDKSYYIGLGKAEEISHSAKMHNASLVIINDELSASQIRNLDRIIGLKVIDRSALILDIFARRAISREGKLQVELAQLQYLLPRLIGMGEQMSKLGGGIGTRGPGETQLEVDRRVIRRRISELKKEILLLRKHRKLHRQRRYKNRCTVISLVGYTNAGKSTLLNALAGSDLYTENKLFATLDPKIRRGLVNSKTEVLYSDTVGFIEHLPPQLINAFQATFEEVAASDILLHVVDITHPDFLHQIQVVHQHLTNIDHQYYKHELLVFNKIDLLDDFREYEFLKRDFPQSVFVSAIEKVGLHELKEMISQFMEGRQIHVRVYLPYTEGKLYAQLKKNAAILKMDFIPGFYKIEAVVDHEMAQKLQCYSEPPVV